MERKGSVFQQVVREQNIQETRQKELSELARVQQNIDVEKQALDTLLKIKQGILNDINSSLELDKHLKESIDIKKKEFENIQNEIKRQPAILKQEIQNKEILKKEIIDIKSLTISTKKYLDVCCEKLKLIQSEINKSSSILTIEKNKQIIAKENTQNIENDIVTLNKEKKLLEYELESVNNEIFQLKSSLSLKQLKENLCKKDIDSIVCELSLLRKEINIGEKHIIEINKEILQSSIILGKEKDKQNNFILETNTIEAIKLSKQKELSELQENIENFSTIFNIEIGRKKSIENLIIELEKEYSNLKNNFCEKEKDLEKLNMDIRICNNELKIEIEKQEELQKTTYNLLLLKDKSEEELSSLKSELQKETKALMQEQEKYNENIRKLHGDVILNTNEINIIQRNIASQNTLLSQLNETVKEKQKLVDLKDNERDNLMENIKLLIESKKTINTY